MKKSVIVILFPFFFLSACEDQKPDIEIPLPTEPPNLQEMRPIGQPS